MLTREGFVAADMSAQGPFQRSSWKAEAIRRGDLKISGPIPITEDVPLNEEEEKEFAKKGGVESSMQPQDAMEEQSERPETPPSPPGISEQPSALRSNPVDNHLPQGDGVPKRQPSRSPPRIRQVNEVQRESVVKPNSTPESAPKAAQKKKRKSGLRHVFRKMFGRKSRDEQEDQAEETTRRGHGYHYSDPGMLRQSPPRQSPPREQQALTGPRISDLPVQELKPLHPLGQHLPFPMNVNAPQKSPPQEYLTFDMHRPRRATLPSVPSTTIHRHSFDEPRGRLATWEERQDGPELSPGIGIALSSPSQATTPMQSKRRSRSADALRDLVKGRASIDRRRSAEIRYWRESNISGSTYSRPQTAKTVETIRSVHAQEPVIKELESDPVIEMSATLVQRDEPETPELEDREPERETEIQPPASAFNFGNLKSAFSDEENMPSTHEEIEAKAPLPPSRSQDRLSIGDRLQHLESKFDNLEFSVRRLSTRNNRQTVILENAPRQLRSRNPSRSSRSASASRPRSTPSIHQEATHQSSSDTPNPGPSSPILPHPAAASGDVDEGSRRALSTMYEALKYERSARKALEQQARTLHQDVSDLHVLVKKLIASAAATSPSYPTPSPDTLIMSTEERLLTPQPMRSESFGEPYRPGQCDVRESVAGKYSRSETGSESGRKGGYGAEEKSAKGSYEDVASPDVWATPKEEGFGGSGFFHSQGKRSWDNLTGYA